MIISWSIIYYIPNHYYNYIMIQVSIIWDQWWFTEGSSRHEVVNCEAKPLPPSLPGETENFEPYAPWWMWWSVSGLHLINTWLVVSTPVKNMSSSVGMMTFPTEWKIKFMFQTTNQVKRSIYPPSSAIFNGFQPWTASWTTLLKDCWHTVRFKPMTHSLISLQLTNGLLLHLYPLVM